MPVPTPTMPGAGYRESLYRGQAMAQLRILKQQMQLGGLQIGTRTVDLGDGVTCYCSICFNKEDAYIRLPETKETLLFASGFISTPRLFRIYDGYSPALAHQGDGSLIYPLNDTTDTSQVLHPLKSPPTIDRSVQLYGNIDWIGKNGVVLTWKGPTGRSIPFDYTKEIPGLTVGDIQFDLMGDPYWTCFGMSVYSRGSIFASAPIVGDIQPKITGCALHGSTLVCAINNHYSNKTGFWDEIWINNGSPGLYDANTNPNGWEKLYEVLATRPTQCWFFNQSGTKCTQGNVEYTINFNDKSVSAHTYPAGSGNYSAEKVNTSNTQELVASTTTITHSGNYVIYSDYKGDTRVTADIRLSDVTTRELSAGNVFATGAVPVYRLGVDGPDTYYIAGPDWYDNNKMDFSFQGSNVGCCPEKQGGLDVWPTGCGMGTITLEGPCGGLFHKDVRLKDGCWVQTGYGVIGEGEHWPESLNGGNWDDDGSTTIYYIRQGCIPNNYNYNTYCPHPAGLASDGQDCFHEQLQLPGKLCNVKVAWETREWRCL